VLMGVGGAGWEDSSHMAEDALDRREGVTSMSLAKPLPGPCLSCCAALCCAVC